MHITDRLSKQLTDNDISNLCRYHDDPAKIPKYEAINEATKMYLRAINELCPPCALREDAFKAAIKLRMLANACIALDGL